MVENHADVGRFLGAEVLLVLSITKNNVSQSHEDIAAFGIVERKYFVASEASISATAIEVDSGRVILRQQYEKTCLEVRAPCRPV